MALAVEEGMIWNIANSVISDGIGAFDAELGNFQAAGQRLFYDQVYQRIAHEAIRCAARAAITAMKNTAAIALGLRPCQRTTEVVR